MAAVGVGAAAVADDAGRGHCALHVAGSLVQDQFASEEMLKFLEVTFGVVQYSLEVGSQSSYCSFLVSRTYRELALYLKS